MRYPVVKILPFKKSTLSAVHRFSSFWLSYRSLLMERHEQCMILLSLSSVKRNNPQRNLIQFEKQMKQQKSAYILHVIIQNHSDDYS